MATFLTSPAMNPALRARVERAVSARARARHHAASIGLSRTFAAGGRKVRLLQMFPIVVAAILGALGFASYRADRRAVAAARSDLEAALAARRAQLPAGHEGFIAATNGWIAEAANDQAEWIAPSLKVPGALDEWLRRPGAYVHMPAAEVGDPRAIDEAARASDKDAFLLCLMKPPASGSERDRLAKVRGTYFAGAKVDDETANVRRLAHAHTGLSAVGPSFEQALRAADTLPALLGLRRELEAAPIAEAARVASAELFIVVVDKGEEARVLLVDLASKGVLMRLRRRVEEAGASPAAVIYREQLQGCALALATRRAAEG